MGFSIPELKECSQMIAGAYSITETDARKILNYYLQSGSDGVVRDLIGGKLDAVTGAADALGITLSSFKGIPEKPNKKRSHKRKAPDAGRDHVQTVAGDVGNVYGLSPDGLGPQELPAGIEDTLNDIMMEFCTKYAVDDMRKASASVWRGACMYIGRRIQESKVLQDRERERKEGGKIFAPDRVAALVPIWAGMCAVFDKAPLACDFIAFSGVSSSWFYCVPESQGKSVTSAGGYIWKKLLELQEQGLSGVLVDGRRNPTGTIFFLKNWHGWRDQREVIHTDGGTATGAAALPVFSAGDGLLIEENPEKP